MAGLKDGVVIKVDAWKVPVIAKKKLLKQPEIAVDIKFDPSEVKEMPDKQYKAFDVAFEKAFTPAFNKMSNSWFAEMQKKLDDTETEIEALGKDKKAKGDPKALVEQIVTKGNAVLANRCKVWIEMAQKLAQKAYEDAFAESLKAMKAKITKAKIKVAVKIIIIVALIATAAALSVVTMGGSVAVSAVIAAAVMGGLKTASGAYKELKKGWDVLGATTDAVESDLKKITKGTLALEVAEAKGAGKLDKAKAFKAALEADVGALDKHVGQLDKFIAVIRAESKKQDKALVDMAADLKKAEETNAKAKATQADLVKLRQAMDKNNQTLDQITALKTEAANVKAAYVAMSTDKLKKALPGLAKAITVIRTGVNAFKAVAEPLQDILKEVHNIVT